MVRLAVCGYDCQRSTAVPIRTLTYSANVMDKTTNNHQNKNENEISYLGKYGEDITTLARV